MTEETQQSPAPVETQTEAAPAPAPAGSAPTQTLEDVYKQFSVDDEANRFTAQPAPNTPAQPQQTFQPPYQAPIPPAAPDPILDPNGYQQFMLNNVQQQAALSQTLNNVNAQLAQIHQAEQQRQVKADIGKAVDKVNERVKANPKFVEIALHQKADEDPRFRALWENRTRNPKAWDAALAAFSSELQGITSVRTDPQLAENQRALKASMRNMATTNAHEDNPMLNMSGSEFEREWERVRRGG